VVIEISVNKYWVYHRPWKHHLQGERVKATQKTCKKQAVNIVQKIMLFVEKVAHLL
jgi:hypothetical protein